VRQGVARQARTKETVFGRSKAQSSGVDLSYSEHCLGSEGTSYSSPKADDNGAGWTVMVELAPEVMGCPAPGVVASSHGRRKCWTRSWRSSTGRTLNHRESRDAERNPLTWAHANRGTRAACVTYSPLIHWLCLRPRAPITGPLAPRKVIQTYDPDEWEVFIEEWATGMSPKYVSQMRRTISAIQCGPHVLVAYARLRARCRVEPPHRHTHDRRTSDCALPSELRPYLPPR
jgi:hypothetical protein